MNNLAPIVVFGYNRPDHLRQTLTKLSQAQGAMHSDLWIFCDGPKPGIDPKRIEEACLVAQDPSWEQRFCSLRIVISKTNKGLARSIISGVSQVLERHDRVIIIEDDILVAPDFICFMNECLDYYHNDLQVGSVTGFSPLRAPPRGYVKDVMAVPRNSSQGWGTWADRWLTVDWEARVARRVWTDPALRRRFNAAGADRADRLRRQLDGNIDSWSIRFGLWQIINNKVTIYPAKNRILNIGYDGSGVHSGIGRPKNETIGADFVGLKAMKVDIDKRVLRAFRRAYSGPWYKMALRNLRVWLLTRGIR